MNNNIKEPLCSFEVSKLLKEKGFKQPTLCYYFEDGIFVQNSYRDTVGMDYGKEFEIEYQEFLENWNNNWLRKKNGDGCFGCKKSNGYFETYSAPTHAIAIEWLRVNFGIHIFWDFGLGCEAFIVPVGYNGSGKFPPSLPNFKTPQESIDAALLYTLKNLI